MSRKLLLVALAVMTSLLSSAIALGSTYWHFTFKAFVDPNDTSAAEWAWVTMVEMPKERAFPEEAATARRYGGRLEGTVFAFVRGAAWRSDHRYTVRTRCKGRPATKDIFWHASESESVYAGGQINTDGGFQFSFTTRPVLMEDGSWFDPQSRGNVFVGPIRMAGEPEEEIKGNFVLYGVNYRDPLEHHRRCGKAWVEQYKSDFTHFQHQRLQENFPEPGVNNIFGQLPWGPDDRKVIVYDITRSHSRDHPHWKRQEM